MKQKKSCDEILLKNIVRTWEQKKEIFFFFRQKCYASYFLYCQPTKQQFPFIPILFFPVSN